MWYLYSVYCDSTILFYLPYTCITYISVCLPHTKERWIRVHFVTVSWKRCLLYNTCCVPGKINMQWDPAWLTCTIVITLCSIINLSHFLLLLKNHGTDFEWIWQETSSQHPLPSSCFLTDLQSSWKFFKTSGLTGEILNHFVHLSVCLSVYSRSFQPAAVA